MAFSLPLCQSCSCSMTPWGRTARGTRRYRCPGCHKTKTRKGKRTDPFPALFRQYVLWGTTYEALSSITGYSIPYLATIFHGFMEHDPPSLPPMDQSETQEAFLLIDGLWFTRWFVLLVYRQSRNLTILHISTGKREVATRVARDLRSLVASGYHFTGIVSDGHRGIVNAVAAVFGHTPHQICLAHRHRAVMAALGRFPKDPRLQELRALADHMWLLESREALRWWENEIKVWARTNWLFIHEKRRDTEGYWWYIHKGLRRAVFILLDLPVTSFHFLSHPFMPKTTNELEAQFGHLGKRWLAHRGLKQERWEQFLKWFVYFYNAEKLAERNTKEAIKNNTKS